jgi:hypothetical protein
MSFFPLGGEKMRLKRKSARRKHVGAVLIVSMIFVVIFSTLAICMATVSGNNVQLASNHQDINSALAAAQSGHEVMRYLLSHVLIPSSTPEEWIQSRDTLLKGSFRSITPNRHLFCSLVSQGTAGRHHEQ